MKRNAEIWLVIAMIIWGGSWTSGKLIANAVDPQVTLFWRFLLSGLFLIPVILIIREKTIFSYALLFWGLLAGVVSAIYTSVFFIALKTGMAGAGGVLVTTLNPLFTFLISFLGVFAEASYKGKAHDAPVHPKEAIRGKDFWGLILGVSAGMILLEVWTLGGDQILLSGNLLFLACAVIYAFITLITGRAARFTGMITFSCLVNLFGAMIAFAISPTLILDVALPKDSGYWFNMFYLSIISNSLATTIYFSAIKKIGSARASAYIFIVPGSALLIAAAWLKEPVKISTLVGGSLAVVAVLLLRRK